MLLSASSQDKDDVSISEAKQAVINAVQCSATGNAAECGSGLQPHNKKQSAQLLNEIAEEGSITGFYNSG